MEFLRISKPNNQNKKDIQKAISTLNRLGKYNFSQGAVVRNNRLIEVEREDGTEKMLKRCKVLRNVPISGRS